jgi:hypothetical protein
MILLTLLALWDYSYTFDVDVAYDNNVYAYSREYIDEFLNGVRSYRFPFETYDDMVTSYDFALLLRNKFFGNRTTTFSANLNSDNFLLNRQKNFQRYTFGLRQSLGRYAVKVSYQVIPGYLIRYYRNPGGEATDYIGCEATYHTAGGKLSFTNQNDITLTATYNRRWDDYIEEFNRYDASGHILSFGIDKTLHKHIDFSFVYEFRNSYNDSVEVSTSPVELTPDGSFYQHSLGGDFIIQMAVVLPTEIRLSYDYDFRNYTAATSEDSLHFGRRDHRHRALLITRSRLMTGLLLKFTLMRQWRNATSEIFSDIDRIKDYTKYKIGAGFEFYY